MRKLLGLLLILSITACASRPYIQYPEPISGDTASIKFVKEAPYFTMSSKAAEGDVEQGYVGLQLGKYAPKHASVIEDSRQCTSKAYQYIDIQSQTGKPVKIPAGKNITFDIGAQEIHPAVFLHCGNTITFNPVSGERYTAVMGIDNKKYFSKKVDRSLIGQADCTLRIYKGDDETDLIDFISRKRFRPFIGGGPSCYASEVENPVKVKEARKQFKCTIRAGGGSC